MVELDPGNEQNLGIEDFTDRRWALIRNGVVDNVILWDGVTPYNPYGELVEVTDLAPGTYDIGWLYADGVFTPPPPEDPPEDPPEE